VITEDRWLAGVFGRPAFRLEAGVDVEQVRAHAREQAAAFYYVKVDAREPHRVHALGGAGLEVVDVNVTLDRAPGAGPAGPDGIDVHDVRDDEHAAVLDIAGRAFQFSRFHLDPLIPRSLAHAVKREWIANYLRGARGERLLVATVNGRAVGFLAVLAAEIEGKQARVIDLVAVAPEAQGLGAGTALVSAFARVASAGSDRLRVGTQVANATSLRLYGRMGFQIVHSAYVLHLHVGSRLGEAA
jgi:ribosomal protein S18 acetylase RimI-like enzyme